MELTHPHWRHLHRFTSYRFHCDILIRFNHPSTRPPVIYTFVNNYRFDPKDIFTYRPNYIDTQVTYLLER